MPQIDIFNTAPRFGVGNPMTNDLDHDRTLWLLLHLQQLLRASTFDENVKRSKKLEMKRCMVVLRFSAPVVVLQSIKYDLIAH